MSNVAERLSQLSWSQLNGVDPGSWRHGSVETVKKSAHRGVYHVRGSNFDLFAKHYCAAGPRSFLRELLRPVKAKREFQIGCELLRRGVSTPKPLAWAAETLGPGASWLVTETIADAEPLSEVCRKPLMPKDRQELAKGLGKFLAELHKHGVIHRDLHPGNILIAKRDGQFHYWLIDLHAVRIQRTSWATRRSNLVIFNRFFSLRTDRSDRLRFWTSYLQHIDRRPELPGIQAREIERLTWESNRRFWAARDRRSLVTNRYYRRIRRNGVRGYCVADLDQKHIDEIASAFVDPKRNTLKDSRTSTVLRINWSGTEVALKRFNRSGPTDSWANLIRLSAPVRSWIFGHGLRERGLPTPRPLALVTVRTEGKPQAVLATEFVPNAMEFSEYVRILSLLPTPDARCQLKDRLHVLARLLRRFHRCQLSHRDLKAANILTSNRVGDSRFWFVDLVGIQRHRHLSNARMARNLSRLNASFLNHPLINHSMRLRFLRSYLGIGVFGSGSWKTWWRQIERATSDKIRQNTRNNRPLA